MIVSEPEGPAEAEVARSTISAETAGIPLGVSGLGHASRPSSPSPGLAEVPTALLQTAGT